MMIWIMMVVPNSIDNCPYVYNPDQRRTHHENVGDACWNDNDNDTVKNLLDNCPNNSLIWATDFRKIYYGCFRSYWYCSNRSCLGNTPRRS